MNPIKTFAFSILLAAVTVAGAASHLPDPQPLAPGDHALSLQWLQNNNGVGKARIYRDHGQLLLDGYQEERYKGELNTMTIKGSIRVISARALEFKGTIVTRISYINEGAPRERKGTFLMKAWGARKFWRMQEMTEPDGQDEVTDYIDLHFRSQHARALSGRGLQ